MYCHNEIDGTDSELGKQPIRVTIQNTGPLSLCMHSAWYVTRQTPYLCAKMHVLHQIKIGISYMQEICRIGQDFLHFSFIHMNCCPILCQINVGDVRKCHILENKTFRKSHFWSSVDSWRSIATLCMQAVSDFLSYVRYNIILLARIIILCILLLLSQIGLSVSRVGCL